MGKNREVQLKADCSPRRLRSHTIHKPTPITPLEPTLPSTNKQPLTSRDAQRKAYALLSRLQIAFKLRFQTLFLSQTIYSRLTSLPDNPIPADYCLLISANLSMKYHQIYPPRLKDILPFLKSSCDLKDYCRWEAQAFYLLQGNLNMPTATTQLDQLLGLQPKQAHFQAYYLVELCQMVDKDYSLREICSSVKFLMSPVGQSLRRVTHYEGVEMGRVMECAKTIVQARTVSCQSENLLFKKYKQVRYLQVSERPFLLEEA